MNYIAIIGELVAGKEAPNHFTLQENLKSVLKRVNVAYSSEFASPFTLLSGGEFQALCKPSPYLFLMLDQIQLAFRGQVDIRFGLGLGTILTAIDPKQSIGADGPAYWEARKALDFIGHHTDYGTSQVAFSSDYQQINRVIYPLLTAADFIKSSWNSSQYELFQTLLENKIYQENFRQKIVAEKMKLSQSAFTKRVKSSGVKIYLRNRQTALALILQLSKKD